MQTVFIYILYFFFYSAVGWLFESIYCSIGEKKLINRGFLTGPICPIYGKGALVMALLLYNPFRDKPMVVFFLGMVFCDMVEYASSFIMEKLFNARWWDYKDELLNVKGRICLKHTLYWGIAATFFVKTVHPIVVNMFEKIPTKYIVPVTSVILVIFTIDLAYAVVKAIGLIKLKNKLNELKELITSNTNEARQQLSDAYLTVKATVEEKYDTLVYSINDKASEINRMINDGNDKFNYKREEIIIDAKLIIEQFERKFKPYRRTNKKHIERREFLNKYSKKFKNADIKLISEELKRISDDVKKKISK